MPVFARRDGCTRALVDPAGNSHLTEPDRAQESAVLELRPELLAQGGGKKKIFFFQNGGGGEKFGPPPGGGMLVPFGMAIGPQAQLVRIQR